LIMEKESQDSLPESEAYTPRFLKWRVIVVTTLLILYTGYYFNRSNLSVATPQILEDANLTKTEFGTVVRSNLPFSSYLSLFFHSVGYGVYAFGKFTNGFLVDIFGGKPLFLLGLGGSAIFTVGFTFFSGIPGFTAMWSINRYLQSMGWGALVKITSKWFGAMEYGRIMGIMSLSYMFGDAMIRLIYGQLLNAGWTWQQLFYFAAVLAVVMLIPAFFTLKGTPKDIGENEPVASEKNIYNKERIQEQDLTVVQILTPLIRAPKFWCLIILSLLLTLIRETFNAWTPVYFEEDLGMDEGDAATASMVFPLAGTFSAFLGGYLVDKISTRYRGLIPLVFLLLLSLCLAGLAAFSKYYDSEDSGAIALALFMVGMTAFFLIAPYSFLDGVFTLDLAGKQGCAATASIINGAGYIGAVLSGTITGIAADSSGWPLVFVILTGMAFVSMAFQALYWFLDLREDRTSPEATRLINAA